MYDHFLYSHDQTTYFAWVILGEFTYIMPGNFDFHLLCFAQERLYKFSTRDEIYSGIVLTSSFKTSAVIIAKTDRTQLVKIYYSLEKIHHACNHNAEQKSVLLKDSNYLSYRKEKDLNYFFSADQVEWTTLSKELNKTQKLNYKRFFYEYNSSFT